MIAVTRAHFTFSGEAFYKGAAGWTETFFMNVPDYATAATQLLNIVNQRLNMLCTDCQCIGGTISDTAVKGDSFPSGIPISGGLYGQTGPIQTYQPDVALRYLWHAGATRRSSRWIRCIPSDQINTHGQYNPLAAFATLVTNYNNAIQTQAYLATKIPGAVAAPFYSLTAYTSNLLIGPLGRKIGRPFSLRRGRALIA